MLVKGYCVQKLLRFALSAYESLRANPMSVFSFAGISNNIRLQSDFIAGLVVKKLNEDWSGF